MATLVACGASAAALIYYNREVRNRLPTFLWCVVVGDFIFVIFPNGTTTTTLSAASSASRNTFYEVGRENGRGSRVSRETREIEIESGRWPRRRRKRFGRRPSDGPIAATFFRLLFSLILNSRALPSLFSFSLSFSFVLSALLSFVLSRLLAIDVDCARKY